MASPTTVALMGVLEQQRANRAKEDIQLKELKETIRNNSMKIKIERDKLSQKETNDLRTYAVETAKIAEQMAHNRMTEQQARDELDALNARFDKELASKEWQVLVNNGEISIPFPVYSKDGSRVSIATIKVNPVAYYKLGTQGIMDLLQGKSLEDFVQGLKDFATPGGTGNTDLKANLSAADGINEGIIRYGDDVEAVKQKIDAEEAKYQEKQAEKKAKRAQVKQDLKDIQKAVDSGAQLSGNSTSELAENARKVLYESNDASKARTHANSQITPVPVAGPYSEKSSPGEGPHDTGSNGTQQTGKSDTIYSGSTSHRNVGPGLS